MLYLGVSTTHAAQLNILEALTRKFQLEPDLQLGAIAERCPFNYTGADFYALCSDAMLKAMTRKAEEIDQTIGTHPLPPALLSYLAGRNRELTTRWPYLPPQTAEINARPPSAIKSGHPQPMTAPYYLSELARPAELAVRVSAGDFLRALDELRPSVSEGEMAHYAAVQRQFQGPPPPPPPPPRPSLSVPDDEGETTTTITAAAAAAASAAAVDGQGRQAGDGPNAQRLTKRATSPPPPPPSPLSNGVLHDPLERSKGKGKGKARSLI